MGRKKRREGMTQLTSSSSRRDSASSAGTTAAQQAHNRVKTVNVGCMSGIFQLVSKYHTRRKFLTFGNRREETTKASSSKPTSKNPNHDEKLTARSYDQGKDNSRRLSLQEAPRSPAIPAEIRTSGSANSPRVVARLMGLDDIMELASPKQIASPEPASEKRRRLLGALEKCDDDLKALKKIIEAVRAVQTPPRLETMRKGIFMDEEEEKQDDDVGSDEPSPVSVLDDYHERMLTKSPPYTGCSKRSRNGQILFQPQQQEHNLQQRQQTVTCRNIKKPGEVEDNAGLCVPNRLPIYDTFAAPLTNSPFLHPRARNTFTIATRTVSQACSRSMRESVDEVCRDVACGETQEVGRIGLLIQDFIYMDLIEEITKEMGSCHIFRSSSRSLPFESCKRKLCF